MHKEGIKSGVKSQILLKYIKSKRFQFPEIIVAIKLSFVCLTHPEISSLLILKRKIVNDLSLIFLFCFYLLFSVRFFLPKDVYIKNMREKERKRQ